MSRYSFFGRHQNKAYRYYAPPIIQGTLYTDSGTVGVLITPSTVEARESADAATVSILITPSAVEIHEYTDTGTVGVVITPSGADTAQFADSATATVVITPSTVEARISTDAGTVPVTLTPSATESQSGSTIDAATVTVTITPGPTAAEILTDTFTRTVPSDLGTADSGQTWVRTGGNSANTSVASGIATFNQPAGVNLGSTYTIPEYNRNSRQTLLLAPTVLVSQIATQGFLCQWRYRTNAAVNSNSYEARLQVSTGGLIRVALVRLDASVATTLVPTTTVFAAGAWTLSDQFAFECQVVDNFHEVRVWKVGANRPSTPTFSYDASGDATIYDNGTNFDIRVISNGSPTADQAWLVDQINVVELSETFQAVDAATVGITLTPSAVETAQYVDTGTVLVDVSASSTDVAADVEALTARVTITPSGTDAAVFVDAATVGMVITPSSSDVAAFVDSATATVTITPSTTVEQRISTDAATVPVAITPSATEFQSSGLVDAGTALITITPGPNVIPIIFTDTFGRTVSNNLGTADTGQTWVRLGGTASSTNVASGIATMAQLAGLNSGSTYTVPQYNKNSRATILVQPTVLISQVSGQNFIYEWRYRTNGLSGSNSYESRFQVNLAGDIRIALVREDNSVATTMIVNTTVYAAGNWSLSDQFVFEVQVIDNIHEIRAWKTTDARPSAPTASYDASGDSVIYDSGTNFDMRSIANGAPTADESWLIDQIDVVEISETLQVVEAATATITITPSAAETRVSTDSATVALTVSPSSTESAQFADSANVPIALSPSAIEAAQFAEAVSVALKLTPSSTDTAQLVESGTIPITITPSSVDVYGRVLTDGGTVTMKLTPTAVESAVFVEAVTVPLTILPGGSDIEAATEAATVRVTLTPSSTDITERAYLDSPTVPLTITPVTTFEALDKSDVGTPTVYITPSLLSEFQGEGDIVPLRITSTLVEVFVHADATVVLLSITGDSSELVSLTTMSTVLIDITPGLLEDILAGVDAATILVSITPGLILEVQQVADYLLVGVLSNKWTAILRANTYAGTLFETRYVVTDFDNRWHYHWRGRGDE